MLDRKKLDEKANVAGDKLGLTAGDIIMLQDAAHTVYEDIAGDIEPDDSRRNICKRDTILEVVLDAGRLELQIMKRLGLPNPRYNKAAQEAHADHRLIKACRNYPLIEDVVGPAFPVENYEVGNG